MQPVPILLISSTCALRGDTQRQSALQRGGRRVILSPIFGENSYYYPAFFLALAGALYVLSSIKELFFASKGIKISNIPFVEYAV